MRMTKVLPVAVIAVSLGACAQQGQGGFGPKTGIGALGGAAAGGLIGAAAGGGAAGIAAGVILGGLLGGAIGNYLDQQDRVYAAQTAQVAMTTPSGTTSAWRNPKTGNAGSTTPTGGTYRDAGGQECRSFSNTVVLSDGRTETSSGTMCRNPADGSWMVSG